MEKRIWRSGYGEADMEKGYGEGIWRRDMEKGYGVADMEKGYGEDQRTKKKKSPSMMGIFFDIHYKFTAAFTAAAALRFPQPFEPF